MWGSVHQWGDIYIIYLRIILNDGALLHSNNSYNLRTASPPGTQSYLPHHHVAPCQNHFCPSIIKLDKNHIKGHITHNLVNKCQCVLYYKLQITNYKILHMLTFANIMAQFYMKSTKESQRFVKSWPSAALTKVGEKILLHLLELNCIQCEVLLAMSERQCGVWWLVRMWGVL